VGVRVLIAEDHAAMRQSLVQALRCESDFEVVGEVADGIAAVQLAAQLKPEVVIMDIVMARLNGIEATRRIKKDHPEIQVVGLSVHSSRGYVAHMLAAGARAYVLKDDGTEELFRAIRGVCEGQTCLSAGLNNLTF
jgi:NarL family two-component system response regulator LiaR